MFVLDLFVKILFIGFKQFILESPGRAVIIKKVAFAIGNQHTNKPALPDLIQIALKRGSYALKYAFSAASAPVEANGKQANTRTNTTGKNAALLFD